MTSKQGDGEDKGEQPAQSRVSPRRALRERHGQHHYRDVVPMPAAGCEPAR